MISFVLYASFAQRGGAQIVFAFSLQSGEDETKFNWTELLLTHTQHSRIEHEIRGSSA